MDDQSKDLFSATLASGDLDPAFAHVRDHPACAEDRAYLRSLWIRFAPFADSNFLDQVQRPGQFASRVWEMQLACLLMDAGHSIRAGKPGPDVTTTGTPPVHFEAVAPGPDRLILENDERARGATAHIPTTEVITRYTGSIWEKHRAYLHWTETGTVNQTDICVIAVSGAKLPWSSDETDGPPWILRSLFGYGGPVIRIPAGRPGPVEHGWHHQLVRKKPSTGADIDCDLFLNEKLEAISALLFSPEHVKNRPEVYGRPPGANLVLAHNPFARNPLPVGFLKMGREWLVTDDKLQLHHDWSRSGE